jgi:hypothetical protein
MVRFSKFPVPEFFHSFPLEGKRVRGLERRGFQKVNMLLPGVIIRAL